MRPHPVLAMGPNRRHPRKLALSCIASQFSGLDGPPLARQRRGLPVKLGRNVTFHHDARGTFGQRSRTRPIRDAK